ncbi:MAG: thioredoxin peroxidase [Chloroflexi bacterium]|nr:thioredoxin peroxidase [Chloroflexi bacterium CFX1]MCQ3953926.1 thioredoxin peroxidase [Chloroflexota bacterium]MDL1919403.1 redoxin domain-containing protein [Chloroflexi bacterium CFX5]NUQ58662.1 redoxin domain-containing protein [Anaerolineales bacterium]RIK55434.1 MAG: thioredoxin peroxidase [Chloroflexota bacterium]
MKNSHSEFTKRGAEILAVGPDSADSFRRYWRNENLPYIGLPDPAHSVARLYRQEVNLFKLGRMPLNAVVDLHGQIRYIHYASDMTDIPDNETFLQVIDQLTPET